MREKALGLVQAKWFQNIIMAIILVNSVTIGIQTFPIDAGLMSALNVFDAVCLGIYVVEIILKLIAFGPKYFKDPWNVFDFTIVAVCLLPATGFLASARVLRTLRALRVMRLVSGLRELRIIIEAIGKSLPGICWTGLLLVIIYYVYAVVGTTLFGAAFPEWFGDLGKSFYTLFQVMTLESWSMGISRPVMEAFGPAWIYFVSFVIISAFIVLNVVVGIVVNTIDEVTKNARDKEHEATQDVLAIEFAKLKDQMEVVNSLVDAASASRNAARAKGEDSK